jgi:tmRNA-binding protein
MKNEQSSIPKEELKVTSDFPKTYSTNINTDTQALSHSGVLVTQPNRKSKSAIIKKMLSSIMKKCKSPLLTIIQNNMFLTRAKRLNF